MLLTRFPPAPEVARTLGDHPNELLHVSITPAVAGAIATEVAPAAVLDAIASVPAKQLFVMIGPLVDGAEGAVRRLFHAIPRGAAVGFKALAPDGVPFPIGVAPIGDNVIAQLAEEARASGLEVPPMAGCRLRTNLRRAFFRHRELSVETPGVCAACPNYAICAAVVEPTDSTLATEAASLGLDARDIHRAPRGINIGVSQPVARADETFLSERLRWPIFLSGIHRGEGFRITEVSEDVLQRWESVGFFPVRRVADLARRMVERVRGSRGGGPP